MLMHMCICGVYIYVYEHMLYAICVCVCLYVCMYVCMYIHAYTHKDSSAAVAEVPSCGTGNCLASVQTSGSENSTISSTTVAAGEDCPSESEQEESIYVHVCTYTHMRRYMCMYAYVYAHVTHKHTSMYLCMHARMHVCERVYTCVCKLSLRIQAWMNTWLHTDACVRSRKCMSKRV